MKTREKGEFQLTSCLDKLQKTEEMSRYLVKGRCFDTAMPEVYRQTMINFRMKRLTVARLRKAISKVITQPSYKENALRLQEAIKRSGGVTRAADIIERAVSTKQPVLD